MDLIDKYANIYFEVARRLVEFANNNDGITERQIREIVDKYGVLDDNTDFVNAVVGKRNNDNKFNGICLFEFDSGTQKFNSLVKNLPIVLNHAERRSLYEAFANMQSKAFIELATVERLGFKEVAVTRNMETLKQCVKAIRGRRWIVFDNVTTDGIVFKHQSMNPQKIEVSASTNDCYVSGYSKESERLIKCKLDRMTIHELISGEDIDMSQFLEEKRSCEPICLSIKDNKGATDRAFNMFSGYEKEGFFDKQTGKYILNIHYYQFEERAIIERILSLGAAAIVVSPQNIVEKIRERLRQQIAKLT